MTTEEIETYTDAIFTVSLTIANKLLPGSYIELVLPEEVKLPSSTGGVVIATGKTNVDVVNTRVTSSTDETTGETTLLVTEFMPSADIMEKNT